MKKYQEIITKAQKEKFAIPQFNINNLEWAKFILEASQEENSPIFLGVSTGAAKYMGGYNTVVGLVKGLIKDLNITIPVLIHLDHATSYEECIKAYNAGFDSLMIDASLEEIEKNITLTNNVAKSASCAIIEAEIGRIGGIEDESQAELLYTNKDQATYFAENVNIELLAAALGSVHGLYKKEPNINFEVMNEIAQATNLPLVLHGGSGLNEEILKDSIKNGVCKINFNTELQIEWNKEVRNFIQNNEDVYDPRKIISSGEIALKTAVKRFINILGSKNKG